MMLSDPSSSQCLDDCVYYHPCPRRILHVGPSSYISKALVWSPSPSCSYHRGLFLFSSLSYLYLLCLYSSNTDPRVPLSGPKLVTDQKMVSLLQHPLSESLCLLIPCWGVSCYPEYLHGGWCQCDEILANQVSLAGLCRLIVSVDNLLSIQGSASWDCLENLVTQTPSTTGLFMFLFSNSQKNVPFFLHILHSSLFEFWSEERTVLWGPSLLMGNSFVFTFKMYLF